MNRGQVTIFEGPDGCGKTTLAREYAEETGAEYFHFGPFPGEDNIAHYYADALRRAAKGGRDIVLDRSWISERIYGPVLRGYDRIGPYRQRSLERLAASCGCRVVLPVVSVATIKESFGEKAELPKYEHLDRLYGGYYNPDTSTLTSLPILRIARAAPSKMVAMIKELDGQRTLPHPVGWETAGHLHAMSVLLVGDRSAEPKLGFDLPDFQWPFGSFSCQGCSIWLSDQLVAAGVPEGRLAWANANDPSLSEILLYPWFDVITLGKTAELIVCLHRQNFHRCPHPQFWKRFHTHELYPLPTLLRSIIQ